MAINNIISNLRKYIVTTDEVVAPNNILINHMIEYVIELDKIGVSEDIIKKIIPINFKKNFKLFLKPCLEQQLYNIQKIINESKEDYETKEDLNAEVKEVLKDCYNTFSALELKDINNSDKLRELEKNANNKLDALCEMIKDFIPELNEDVIEEFDLW